MMRPWRLVALFALPVLTACGDNTGPNGGIFGTYTLRSIDGVALPWVYFQNGADKEEVSAGTMSLEAGGTYTKTVDFRATRSGVVSTQRLSASGTFTYTGAAITLRTQTGEVGTASVSSGTLTISSSQGGAEVYAK
jgi:hypothetical protein